MGAFLHSLHVRSSDPAQVQRMVAEAGQSDLRAWIAPGANGWVTVVPEDMNAVLALGPLLSAAGRTEVLATLVHDSDVFMYLVFRGGEKIEEYVSDPDYFEPQAKQTPRVTPRHVLELLPKNRDVSAVTALLTGEMPDFVEEVLGEFARHFDLTYALLTYDDVATADAPVPRRREFLHVPDLAREKTAKQAAKKQLRDAKRALQKSGRLIFDTDLTRSPRAYDRPFEFVGAAPGGGFFVLNFGQWKGLMRWDPPAEPVPFATLPGLTSIECGPVLPGNRMIVARSGQGMGVVDLESGEFQLRYPMNHGWPMAYDAGSDLAYLLAFGAPPDEDVLTAVRLRDGTVEFQCPLSRGVRKIISHPTRPELCCVEQRTLRVFDKRTGASLFAGDFYNEALVPKKKAQWKDAGFDNPGGGRVADRDIFAREDFLGALAFDATGEWLIAGTTEGLRFFRYEELFARPGHIPTPAFGLETSVALQDCRWVHDLLVREGATEVIYTCGDDSLRCFDWTKRVDRELKPASEARCLFGLALSGDRRQLACQLNYRGEDWKRHQGESWIQVWDYAALLG